jgi:hypothetical protein
MASNAKIYPIDESGNFDDIYEDQQDDSLNMINPMQKSSSDDFNTALRLAFRNYCMIEWVMGKCTKGDACRYDHSARAQEYCQQASVHLQKRTISELRSPELGFGVVKEIGKPVFNKSPNFSPVNKSPNFGHNGYPRGPPSRVLVAPKPVPHVPKLLQGNHKG